MARAIKYGKQSNASRFKARSLFASIFGMVALVLEAGANKTGNYNSVSIDLGANFVPAPGGKPMLARIAMNDLDFADGNETYSFVVQHSSDNGTFVPCGPTIACAAGGGWPPGYIGPDEGPDPPQFGQLNLPCSPTRRYIRLALVVGGTTPHAQYSADIVGAPRG